MPFIDEEPIVTVQIESEICAYEVAVNDIPILKGPEAYPISVEIPVNHWLLSGVNSMSLKVGPSPDYPGGDEDAKCEVTLYAKRNGAPREQRKKITELKWSAKEGPSTAGGGPSSGDQQKKVEGAEDEPKGLEIIDVKPVEVDAADSTSEIDGGTGEDGETGKGKEAEGMTLSRKVELRLPLPEWAWLKGEEIPADDVTKNSLLPHYQEAWELLSAGNWQALTQRSATKIRELTDAFYEEFNVMEKELAYQELVNNEDVQIHPWEPDDLHLEVFADGRLARLARWDGEAPLIFVYNDESAAHYLDIMYCKTAEGWLIIR